MSVRLPGLGCVAIVAVLVAGGSRLAWAGSVPVVVNIHVDCVVASDTKEGVDARLASMGDRLHSLFSYSSYRLISHNDGQTTVGNLIAFDLPGGRILHVQPHEINGNMISMILVLFQGERPLMTTDLKLREHGVLILGGPRYEQGMLIVSLSADTIDGPRRVSPQVLPLPAASASAVH